jgi:plastocyanin
MRATHLWSAIIAVAVAVLVRDTRAEPKPRKPAPVTRADIDLLERRIEEQQKQIDKLVKAQQQYLQTLRGMFDPPASSQNDAKPDDAKPAEPRAAPPPDVKADVKPPPADKAAAFTDTRPKPKLEPKPVVKKKPDGAGTIVGKITGVGGAVVYVDDIIATARGSATMKQEGKQFVPSVLVVPKGTTVAFPNMDAIFHNVFSVTPDHSFDLGSYPQGESKTVTMTRPGVVSVYCNMHPQMVGHILVVPNANYVRAGGDGFFRLTNVPAGRHRVVAWAPNAKPVTADAEVTESGVVTIELELKAGRAGPHTKKDGLPYGSYGD